VPIAASSLSPARSTSAVGLIIHDVWSALSSSSITLVAIALLVGAALLQAARALGWPTLPRDPQRRFTQADKALIVARAGGRCEHHGWISGRCQVTDRLEADHVHPHSKGGHTTLDNGQALCGRHNRRKAARVPYRWQLNRLAKHRLSYDPPGVSPATAHPSARSVEPSATVDTSSRRTSVRCTQSMPGVYVQLPRWPNEGHVQVWGRAHDGWWGLLTWTARIRLHGDREHMDIAAWIPATQLTKPRWITAETLPRMQLPAEPEQWPQPLPGWPGWYVSAWPDGPLPLPPDVELDTGPAWRR
jgi:hypothetical protein